MGMILQFEPGRTSRRTARALGDVPTGEVIIFPGVRIERAEFSLSDRISGPDHDNPGRGRRARRSTRK